MGNSHSQSFSRFTPSVLHNNSSNSNQKEGRGKKPSAAKFASPENRVLPIASNAPQRLRSTDNGSILQSGGTISGRKSNVVPIPGAEPEFVQLLQKKCNALQSTSQNVSFQTLYGHRKSHSDPDIVRMMMCENDNESEDEDEDTDERCEAEGSSNQRSIIAVSPSKAKIKSRKKKRAPEPPLSNTLPRSLSRTPVNYKNDNPRKPPSSHSSSYDYNDAPRRPLPPIPPEELPPPPPPPPPDYNRGIEDRGVTKTLSKNYEKNRRTVDKWKFSKPNPEPGHEKIQRQRSKSLDRTEDQRLRECEENRRNERFDRNNSLRNVSPRNDVNKSPADDRKEQKTPNALKDAIADAAKRRAERLERAREYRNPSFKLSMKHSDDTVCNTERGRQRPYVNGNLKQYSYSNPVPYKQADSQKLPNSGHHRHDSRTEGISEDKNEINNFSRRLPCQQKQLGNRKDYRPDGRRRNDTRPAQRLPRSGKEVTDEKVTPSASSARQSKWDSIMHEPLRRFLPDGTPSSSSTSEEEMEIDLQLRPTLPRRPVELPRFSPTDVWKSINLDFFKSHQQRSDVSSDEGDDIMEEKIHRINRPVAPRRLIHDRSGDSGISPDAGSPMLLNDNFDSVLVSNNTMCNPPITPLLTEEPNAAWVPQHDLADDSECGSDDSPPDNRTKPPKKDGQAKFAMPNLMFVSRSLPRTDQRNDLPEEVHVTEKDRTRSRGRRKKSYRNAEGQHFNSLRNLKKALGLRSKAAVVEDSKGLDPNWSLSRSLPNFINNLNTENFTKPKNDSPDTTTMDIRRSNSESRALQQENSVHKMTNGLCSQNSNIHWRNNFPCQSPEGHVIYLPEYSSNTVCQPRAIIEDIHVNTDSELVLKKPSGRKKFTYQSTVRQEEKKKLEEKLAREVEAREKKRQKEIEWMNKVEDEFRKQRDKEKVNIRHQLRILNLQEKSGDTQEPYRKESMKRDVEDYNENIPRTCSNGLHDSAKPQCETLQNSVNTNNDSTDVSYNWKQPTGMRKWLRRQNRDYRCMSPTRPEPEGGRSSSDDCKQMDGRRDGVPERTHSYRVSYQTDARPKCNHGREAPCDICSQTINTSSSAVRLENKNKTPSSDARPSTLASSTETKKVERQKSTKEQVRPNLPLCGENVSSASYLGLSPDANDCHYISESVEEYELHTRLCRTNSGRTFESHSYYALERRKEDPIEYDSVNKTSSDSDPKNNFFSTLNFEKELKENVRKKTREFEKRSRKYQSCDYDSDDSGSDGREVRHQRPTVRNQKKKSSGESREPSFSRNHPHRSGARGKSQINGHAVNGRTPSYSKTQNNLLHMPQQRISSSVLG